ncbi:MAG TPA: BTAD domain-containing putative transcriptional regulator [Methylomirabilota bacterium]|nr:BTAD domain-containing putative transcriptional regulator [Methylomirabilota bacterium]
MQRVVAPRPASLRPGVRAAGLIPVALAAVPLIAFLPILGNGFVDWDDTRNLLDNPHYRGLGWAQLRWMATESHHGHFVPLAWLTFALDYLVWGMNPTGYHLTSLVIHAAATAVLYLVARVLITRAVRVTAGAATAGAATAALLFAVHPLRVESVAWATERRDVLSGLFFLLTVLAYVRSTAATGTRRRWLLAASVVAHLAALLSKSITITAPLVLLLLDIYPLRRLSVPGGRRPPGPAVRVLGEKAPHALLSAAQALVTYQFFRADFGEVGRLLSWREGLPRVLLSLWFYPWKVLVPLDLSPLYEAPVDPSLADPSVLRAAAGVVLITVLAWLLRRRCPGIAAAWASYIIMLAPVAGVVSLGYHLTADRYSYVPCLGFSILAGGGVAAALDAAAHRPARRWLAPAVLGLTMGAVIVLGVLTWRQAEAWRDTTSLWRQAVRATPGCVICHVNLGHQLLEGSAADAALGHFHRAIALQPGRAATYRSLGLALEATGRRAEAIHAYREGLGLTPHGLAIRLSLATALLGAGRLDETVVVVDEALRYHEPAALAQYFEDVARHKPDAPVPRLGLVRAWRTLGERERARAELDVLRRLHPGLAGLAAAGGEPS